jgi:tape measure domain-containing protein
MAGKNTVQIVLSAKDKASKAVRQAFGTVGKNASMAMDVVKTGAVAAGAALVTLSGIVGNVGVSYNAMMEQSAIAWETILGSQQEAMTTIKELQQMGAKTPFQFEGLDRAAKLLNMAGFEGEGLFQTLTNVGDAVSAVGGGTEELQGISMAIFQMASKSKISAEEMNQLAERGIPGWQMIAEQMGKSTQEVMKMSENGELFAKDVLPMLTKEMGERFGGAMEKQSKTFNGLLSTAKDNLKMLSAEMAKPLFEKLKKGMESVVPFLKGFLELAKGNFVGFSEIVTQAFGQKTGLKIMQFVITIQEGMAKVKEYLAIGKEAIKGLVSAFQGNEGATVSILTRLGLNSEQIQLVQDAVSGIKGFIQGMVSYWRYSFNLAQEQTMALFDWLAPYIVPVLTAAFGFIKDQLAILQGFWRENGSQIIQAVQNAFSMIKSIIEFIMPVILFIIKMVWENIKGIISGALSVIMGAIKIFSGIFTGDFSKMWEGVKQLFAGAIEFVWNLINLLMFGRIFSGIKAFVTSGVGKFQEFWKQVVSVFKNLDTHVFAIVGSMFSKVFGRFRGFYDDAVGIFNSLKAMGMNSFTALKNTLLYVAGLIYAGVRSKFTSLLGSAKSSFSSIYSFASSIFSRIKYAMTNPIEAAKNLIKSSIDKIKGFFANMKVKIPMPHFNVSSATKKIAGIKVPVPNIDVDWYDKGGVFYGPQVIGVGEKRPEFVGALDDLRRIVREESGKGGNSYNITVNGNNVDMTEERLLKTFQRVEALYG